MHSRRFAFLLITCLLVLASALAAGRSSAQSISGITGSPAHSAAVTISGTGFGTRAQPTPMQYDDFEEGSSGGVLTTSSGTTGWSEVGSSTGLSANFPHYSPSAVHAGSLGMYCNFDPPVYNCSVNLHNQARFQSGFYLDAWMRYFRPQNDSRSWKPWDLYGSSGGTGWGNPVIDWFGTCTGAVTFAGYTDIASPSGFSASMNANLATFTGTMHHLQVWAKPNSPTGASNGVIRITVDGVDVLSRTNMMFIGAGTTNTWARLGLGYYMSHDQQSQPSCVTPVGTGGAMYWDNVYIDNTQARVELGNAATYAACTYREIQIPTAWSTTEVGISFNQGTFQPGNHAWLFVVNADGAVSPGYEVTIGGTVPSGPGQPGKPTF